MGKFTEQFLKPAKKDYDPPRGKAICEALRNHHWGTLEKYVPGPDGALGWRPYWGCKRCGIEH